MLQELIYLQYMELTKGIDPTLKPENQSKSQQNLAKPEITAPNQRPIKPVVKWSPSKTPIRSMVRNPVLFAKPRPSKYTEYPSTSSNLCFD